MTVAPMTAIVATVSVVIITAVGTDASVGTSAAARGSTATARRARVTAMMTANARAHSCAERTTASDKPSTPTTPTIAAWLLARRKTTGSATSPLTLTGRSTTRASRAIPELLESPGAAPATRSKSCLVLIGCPVSLSGRTSALATCPTLLAPLNAQEYPPRLIIRRFHRCGQLLLRINLWVHLRR